MRSRLRVAALVTAVLLAGCGGGGGGGEPAPTPAPTPAPAPAPAPQADLQAQATILSVRLRDMVTGAQRLHEATIRGGQLSADGLSRTTACATGTVTSVTVTPLRRELRADNCVLLLADGLVYDGTWVFEKQISQEFAFDSRRSLETIDASNARFGYGAATEQAAGGILVSECCYQPFTFHGLPGTVVTLPDVGPVVLSGTPNAFTADLPSGRRLAEIRGGADGSAFAPQRSVLTTTAPLNATLQPEGDGVRARVDRDRDGIADQSLFVNWSEFRTAGSTSALVAALTAPSSTITLALTPVVPKTDQDAIAIRDTVMYYDMMAGTERLMGRSPVDILAPAGTTRTRACATGSVTGAKISATTYVLTAANCVLWGTEPLVYDGTWVFQVTTNTYTADGTCPAGTECLLRADIDTSAARFGYRAANRQVLQGIEWERKTTAAGTDAYVVFPDVPFTFPQGTFPVRGTSRQFGAANVLGVLDITAGRIADPADVPMRPVLRSSDPIIGVAWMVPDDRGIHVLLDNGARVPQPARSLLVPWTDFE